MRLYSINCRDVGMACDFATQGGSLEAVLEHCAEHGRIEHGMRSIGIDLYARMLPHIRVAEVPAAAAQDSLDLAKGD